MLEDTVMLKIGPTSNESTARFNLAAKLGPYKYWLLFFMSARHVLAAIIRSPRKI